MDVLHRAALPSADSLREHWRAASVETAWLRPHDWYHPAVDALVEALAERENVASEAERLGYARARAGVSIAETIDDVACLYRTRGLEPDLEVVRAVSVGWVNGYEATPAGLHVCDPESGVATVAYLTHRLREVYGAMTHPGTSVSVTGKVRRHGLLVVDIAVDGLDLWQRVAQSAATGRALTETFGEGYPVAALGNGRFVALTRRSPDEAGVHAELRLRVERAARILCATAAIRRPPRLWVEPLPSTHPAAVALVRHLQR